MGRHDHAADQSPWRAPVKKKQEKKPPTPEVIVFVTRGDEKKMDVFGTAAKVFADLKANPANRIIMVDTVQQATKALEGLAPSSLKKVVLLGHGLPPRRETHIDPANETLETRLRREGPGFIFKGRREPDDFYYDDVDNILWASSAHAPSNLFFARLAEKLAPDAHVYLQSCYSGRKGSAGSLVKRAANALSPDNSKPVTAAGYENDLLYERITNEKNGRVIGYGSRTANQPITPFEELKGFVTNPAGIPPQDVTEKRGSTASSQP